MAAIFIASSQPALPDLPAGLTNHTGHFIGYAILSALALRAFAGAGWRGVVPVNAIKAAAFAAVYGATDELHQMFVPNRYAGLDDWIADALGAAAGVGILLLAKRAVLARRAAGRDV